MNLEDLLPNIFLFINIVYLMFLNASIKHKTLTFTLINIAYYINFFILKKKNNYMYLYFNFNNVTLIKLCTTLLLNKEQTL